jgi:hypothetical protein
VEALAWQGLGMLDNLKNLVADNLVKNTAKNHINYWSPLSCLVEEQEEDKITIPVHHILSITLVPRLALQPSNKIAAKWARKVKNRSGIPDTGCTSSARAENNVEAFHDTCLPLGKVFMLPDSTKVKATNWMQLKLNLRDKASEINIVPKLHSTLISVPKMADLNYITVFEKDRASIYNATTTTITASKDPVLIAPKCQDTALWKLDIDYQVNGCEYPDQFIAGVNTTNAIFDLPDNRQTLLYYHATAGFPTKETFLSAVRAGNYLT